MRPRIAGLLLALASVAAVSGNVKLW